MQPSESASPFQRMVRQNEILMPRCRINKVKPNRCARTAVDMDICARFSALVDACSHGSRFDQPGIYIFTKAK